MFQKLASGELHQIEGLTLTARGRQVPVEVRTSLIDYAGKPALLLHVRDVSERKQAEDALKGSEIRFHSVWENSVDGMRLTDENGTIIAVNEAFCKLAGMKREELEGKPFTATYSETQDLDIKLQHYRQRFQERTIEKRIQRKLTFRTGKTVELEGSNSFVEARGPADAAARACSATSLEHISGSRNNCANRKRWTPSGSLPAASRMISTTS